jgi:hypothetical protein
MIMATENILKSIGKPSYRVDVGRAIDSNAGGRRLLRLGSRDIRTLLGGSALLLRLWKPPEWVCQCTYVSAFARSSAIATTGRARYDRNGGSKKLLQ